MELDIVIDDEDYNRVLKITKEIGLRAHPYNYKNNLAVNQENFTLPPGKYNFAIQIRNPESKKIGIYKTILEVKKFPPRDTLTISDIQLSFNIKQATSEGRFVKHGLRVTPYPFRVVRKEKPLYIYYEIYNLKKDAFGRTHYRVEYAARTVKKKRRNVITTVVSRIGRIFGGGHKESITTGFERRGVKETQIEYIALDLSKLPQGDSELTIRIKDLNRSKEIESSIQFELIE